VWRQSRRLGKSFESGNPIIGRALQQRQPLPETGIGPMPSSSLREHVKRPVFLLVRKGEAGQGFQR